MDKVVYLYPMAVEYYKTDSGKSPFYDWFNSLERKSQYAVMRFIDRVARGGSCKNVESLGDDVWEIKIRYKAMRVYFGKTNGLLVLLGGGKSRQSKDIGLTKKYWRCYAEEERVLQQDDCREDA